MKVALQIKRVGTPSYLLVLKCAYAKMVLYVAVSIGLYGRLDSLMKCVLIV
jgi:hypothetical protein